MRLTQKGRRWTWVASFATAGLVAATFGTAHQSQAAVMTHRAAAGSPIIIGDTGAETGFMENFDGPASNAALLAAQDINAHGGVMGRKLKIIHIDSKSDKPTDYNVSIQLINEGAKAIIAGCDFDYGGPAATAANSRGVVSMSQCASDPRFGLPASKGGIGPLVFQMGSTTNNDAAIGAEFGYDIKHWRSVWVLTDKGLLYSQSLGSFFITRWDQLAGKSSMLGQATFSNTDLSIAAQIAQFKSLKKKPDFIWLASYLPGGGTAIRQMRAAGINTPIVTAEAMEGSLLFSTAGKNLTNYYAMAYGYLNGKNPTVRKLVAEYKKRFHKTPATSQFLTGYATVQAFATGMRKCQCTDGKGVANALETLHNATFANLNVTWSKTVHFPIKRAMDMWQVQNGKQSFLMRYTPKKVPSPTG